MRATRSHDGRDQRCTGRTASSSRPKRRKLSRLAANFYSIRAFNLSNKSAAGLSLNVEIAKTEPLGLAVFDRLPRDRRIKFPSSSLPVIVNKDFRVQERK